MPDDDTYYTDYPVHAVFDKHGFDAGCTPIDTMMANEAMSFDMAGAMNDEDCY